MIFHTAAEKVYYNAFFKNWHTSIKKIYPSARFSLRFVGPTTDTDVIAYCNSHHILLSLDPITYQEIVDKFNVTGKRVNGYYCMSRWTSIPILDESVFVTDVDLIATNKLIFSIDDSLNEKPWFTISKRKAPDRTLKLMAICLHKDLCERVSSKAITLLENSPLIWSLDLQLLKYLTDNFNYTDYVMLGEIDHISKSTKAPFAYASPMPAVIDGIVCASGLDSKIARYKLAKSHGIF